MNSNASALAEDLQNLLREEPENRAKLSNLLQQESEHREKLRETARKLSMALETPSETVQRLGFLPLVTTICRIATKLNLFNILVESDGPKSGEELAKEVNADHDLLLRLLRYLAANGVIGEAGENLWTANNVTKNLTVPALEAGLNFCYDLIVRTGSALPAFLEETNYRNPTDPKKCAFQSAFGTTDNMFEWLPKHREFLQAFSLWMTSRRVGPAEWLKFFPFREHIMHGFQPTDDAVLIVDIGGGMGQVLEAILDEYPGLEGRCILQDLQETIKQIQSPRRNMELMVHDFFTPQPIKGARVYHLRNVMHDWPDRQCQLILEHVIAAMEKDYSKLLIHELVLPNVGANVIGTQVDLTMMICNAAMERTERQWRKLIESVGLKIEKIWTYTPDAGSIIEIVLP